MTYLDNVCQDFEESRPRCSLSFFFFLVGNPAQGWPLCTLVIAFLFSIGACNAQEPSSLSSFLPDNPEERSEYSEPKDLGDQPSETSSSVHLDNTDQKNLNVMMTSVNTLSERVKALEEQIAKTEEARQEKIDFIHAKNSEEKTYNQSLALMKDGLYDQAEQNFALFVRFYPRSVFRSYALYWQGLCLMMTRRYFESVAVFQSFLRDWPGHEKALFAILKKVRCLENLARYPEACAMLNGLKKERSRLMRLSPQNQARFQEERASLAATLKCQA